MPSACRWLEPARARSRKAATPVAKSTSLSSAPRTVFMRSARGFSFASRRSSRATAPSSTRSSLFTTRKSAASICARATSVFLELPLDVGRVDQGDDRVEPEAGVLDPVGERLGVGEPGRLDDDEVRLRGVDDLLDRQVEAVVVDRAADAAARQLDHLLDVREAGHHLAVDPDLADLVHDDGDGLPPKAVLEHVAQERRLPAAEGSRSGVDRDVRISGAAGRRARRARAVPSGGAAWARCRRSTRRAAGREAAPPPPRSRG